MMNRWMNGNRSDQNGKLTWMKAATVLAIAGGTLLPVALNQSIEAQQGPVNPLAQPVKDPWVNSFKGDDIALKLVASTQQGQYTGTLTFKGQSYPVTASQSADGSIAGQFTVQGNAFPLSATLNDGTMKLTSSGTVYIESSPESQAQKPVGYT